LFFTGENPAGGAGLFGGDQVAGDFGPAQKTSNLFDDSQTINRRPYRSAEAPAGNRIEAGPLPATAAAKIIIPPKIPGFYFRRNDFGTSHSSNPPVH
jgi:hypothetical protein